MKTSCSVLTIVSFALLSSAASAGSPGDQRSRKSLTTHQFCNNLSSKISELALGQGIVNSEAEKIGARASNQMIQAMTHGALLPYLNAKTFMMSQDREKADLWFLSSDIIVSALGRMPRNVLVIDDVNELKYTPQMMPRSQLLVIAGSKGSVDQGRAKLVASAATALGIEVYVIWVGQGNLAGNNLKDLRFISSSTNGEFVNLGTKGACTGDQITLK